MNDTLHVVTTIANPIRWTSRVNLARAAIVDWLRDPNVHVTIAEIAHGARGYDRADLGEHMRVTHVPVRATTLAWSKEDCLNIEPGSRHSFPQVRMGCEGHSCPSALPRRPALENRLRSWAER